jgi:hypothetical protein
MAGHPSVKKRQKEMQRKERQAEKLSKRDERRAKRNDPTQTGEPGVDTELPSGDLEPALLASVDSPSASGGPNGTPPPA